MYVFITIILIIIAFYCGWLHAHSTIASECKKLGKFYVGDTVYHCTETEKKIDG